MIKQTNTENVGIDVNNAPDGYQHGDGLVFDESHPAWIIHKNFEILSKDIITRYPNAKSVLDVGSGAGNLRYTLKEHNPDLMVVTLDGNKETINSPLIDKDSHFILRTDFEYKLVDDKDVPIKFDIICSFEHFEHISPETFDMFIENIKRHSHENTIIIASAATWKYPTGNVHCNVKTLKEWKSIMSERYGMAEIKEPILNQNNWGSRLSSTSELHYKVYG